MTLAHWLSGYNRKRKWQLFLSQILPTQDTTVLDVGYCEKEFSPTDNFIEKHYPHPHRITALGITPANEFATRYPAVRAVCYDGTRFPFADNEFDVCWSNAVIEHVGNRERQLQFLQEVARVSKRAFITTPNRFFPVEVHTRTPLLHFLPKKTFDAYLVRVGKRWATGSYMSLLSERDLKGLLSQAGIERYRLFRNRLLGFTADFAVVMDCERGAR
ncbi:MAG: class I SAM-dependent methyltransferase [Steroidobacteraceae bacterium]